MRAYSLDLRSHLVGTVRAGTSKADAARVFGVSLRTINRSLKQRADTESLAATPLPGRRRQIPPDAHPALEGPLGVHPDATREQHCARWETSHTVRASSATLSRSIARVG